MTRRSKDRTPRLAGGLALLLVIEIEDHGWTVVAHALVRAVVAEGLAEVLEDRKADGRLVDWCRTRSRMAWDRACTLEMRAGHSAREPMPSTASLNPSPGGP